MTEDFYYRGLRHLVNRFIATCDSCQRNKYSNRNSSAPMQHVIPQRPGDLLSIDFYGPLPVSRGGVKHILVTIDAFSKFVVLYPIKKANAITVINKIFGHYIPNFGKPKKIQCDHGTQFTGARWEKKLTEENIQLIFSSIRHPQSNVVERVNRELGRFFRTFVGENHRGWASYINVIHNCINETMHESTEMTPIELHCNIKPARVWKNWLKVPIQDTELPYEEKIYLAHEKMTKKAEKRAVRHDKNKVFVSFNLGDEVLVKANNVSDSENSKIAKFFAIYEGPYILEKKVGESTYLLVTPAGKERGKFHVANLKKYSRVDSAAERKS